MLINGEQSISVNANKSSFSGMILTICRLIRTESRERFEMISESRMNYALKSWNPISRS